MEGLVINAVTTSEIVEKFATVEGLRLRTIEIGAGPAVLMLHGASLGSSGDVFRRVMPAFARAGLRAIAMDLPGYGGSDKTGDHSAALRKRSITGLMDALGLQSAALMGHSQSGTPVVQIALDKPARVTHAIVLGTGSLLPPYDGPKDGGRPAAERAAATEPTLEDTRKLLEANLFHRDSITPEELALRQQWSTGANFEAFLARSERAGAPKGERAPLWEKLVDLRVPLMMIYGKQDRGHAFERATRLKQLYPALNLAIIDNCKHHVPWDAADVIAERVPAFVKS